MSVEQKQDGEDLVFFQRDRSYGGALKEILRLNGTTAKAQATGGLSASTPLQIEWDKAAADGAAGTATAEHVVYRATGPVIVKSVEYVPDAALTANDTNFATITLSRRNADGTNSVTVASVSTKTTGGGGSGNWSQWVSVALALTAANVAMVAGQILTIAITKPGAGVVVPAGQLLVDYALN